MQGLRKSGAMYKLRLSSNDYQAVQLETGHNTPVVLMAHYNEIMEVEKSSLAEKVERDFYADQQGAENVSDDVAELFQAVLADPEKLAMLKNMLQ